MCYSLAQIQTDTDIRNREYVIIILIHDYGIFVFRDGGSQSQAAPAGLACCLRRFGCGARVDQVRACRTRAIFTVPAQVPPSRSQIRRHRRLAASGGGARIRVHAVRRGRLLSASVG